MLTHSGNFRHLHNLLLFYHKTGLELHHVDRYHKFDLDHVVQLIEAAEENRRPFGTQLFPFRTIAMILSMISLVLVSKGMVGKKMMLIEMNNMCRSSFQVWLFKNGKLTKEQDYFRCIVNIDSDGSEVRSHFLALSSPLSLSSCCQVARFPCCPTFCLFSSVPMLIKCISKSLIIMKQLNNQSRLVKDIDNVGPTWWQ